MLFMRWILIVFTLGMLTFPLHAQVSAGETFYLDATKLYEKAKYAEALQQLNYALEAEPGNVRAKALQRTILRQHSSSLNSAAEEAKMSQYLLPEVKVTDASVTTVLEYLRAAAMQASGGEFKPNFVVRGSGAALDKRITIDLQGVPFMEALRYICQMAGLEFRVERHAIVIEPIAPALPPVAVQPSESAPANP